MLLVEADFSLILGQNSTENAGLVSSRMFTSGPFKTKTSVFCYLVEFCSGISGRDWFLCVITELPQLSLINFNI